MVARQSKQAPMPQKRPRGAPWTRGVSQDRTPLIHSDPAIVWPGRTGTDLPSKLNSSPMGTSREALGSKGRHRDGCFRAGEGGRDEIAGGSGQADAGALVPASV